jgi:hypothetical protein
VLQDLDHGGRLLVKDIDSTVVAPSDHDSTRLTEGNLLGKFPRRVPGWECSFPSTGVQLVGVETIQDVVDHNLVSKAIDGSRTSV